MISASHNPYQDNGLKLFGPDGYKLSDAVELEIESHMDDDPASLATLPEKIGRAKRLDDAPGRYIEFVKSTFPKHLRLDGLKIVIDCANGAGYQVGPIILWELGAEVVPLSVAPNGLNINKQCGSTHPEALVEAVKREGADLGIALDGDADRLVMVDETGQVIDGDQLLAMIATHAAKSGQLKGGAVVSTQMANLGLEHYLAAQKIMLHRTKVGDRYVMEKMRESGCNIGGEPSGHIILGDYATTGDALVAALQALALKVETGRKMSAVAKIFTPVPQAHANLRFEGANPLVTKPVTEAIARAEKTLGKKGRVVVRASGTEPLIRVMVEGENQPEIAALAEAIAAAIRGETNPRKTA
jgi:phosphoglucosamine mutase